MALSDKEIQALSFEKLRAKWLEEKKNKGKKPPSTFKVQDGEGLYLVINKTGGKLWRFDYTFWVDKNDSKRKTLSLF